MQEVKDKLNTTLELMGFSGFRVELDEAHRKMSIFIDPADPAVQKSLPTMVSALNSFGHLITKRLNQEPVVIDINNYRKERENIIIDLAKAAARKAVATKEAIPLPAMNAYERRLVHAELGMRPDVRTESVGEGAKRYVVVKSAD